MTEAELRTAKGTGWRAGERAELRSAVERVRRRADSTLQPLPDHEFASGLAAMERAAAAEATPTPVVDHLDLLVLR